MNAPGDAASRTDGSAEPLQGIDRRIDAAWETLTSSDGLYAMASADVGGVELRTFAAAPRNLMEVWDAAADFADREYLIFDGERISYREAHATVGAVAAWLASRGVAPGDRVGIAMRNYPEWMLTFWAILRVGATVVGLNAWWIAEELAAVLADAGLKVLFCDHERLGRLPGGTGSRGTGFDVVLVRASGEGGVFSWRDVVRTTGLIRSHDAEPDDDACIFYTSGTTGQPKGGRLTHRGCINTVLGIGFLQDVGRLAAAGEAASATGSAPRALVTTPLFHVTATNCTAIPATAVGGTLVLMSRWDPEQALRIIGEERITVMSGAPTMMRDLLQQRDATRHDLSTLRTVAGGGAQVPPDLVERVADDEGAMQPSSGFGMTETCGFVSGIAGEAYRSRPTSCGRPTPTFDVKVVDDAGAALPTGAVGELLVRGPGVIAGYLNDPEATAEAIVEGWLRTGDLARLDDQGYIFIVDRKKDVVIRGGENVYCVEVEAALHRHAAILEACVFSVPDDRLGEEVGAAIFPRSAGIVDVEAVRSHLQPLIAAFKIPRYLWILDSPLPRNASGKVLRREVRARLVDGGV